MKKMVQHELLPFLQPIEIFKFGTLNKKCNRVVDPNNYLLKENINLKIKDASNHFEYISCLWLSLTHDELKNLIKKFKSEQPGHDYKGCWLLKQFNSFHKQIKYK